MYLILRILQKKNADYVEGLLPFVRDVAKELGISKDGYRLIFNTGGKAGQTVFHMHAHLLGGEENGLARSLRLCIMYYFYNTY